MLLIIKVRLGVQEEQFVVSQCLGNRKKIVKIILVCWGRFVIVMLWFCDVMGLFFLQIYYFIMVVFFQVVLVVLLYFFIVVMFIFMSFLSISVSMVGVGMLQVQQMFFQSLGVFMVVYISNLFCFILFVVNLGQFFFEQEFKDLFNR